MQRSTFKDPQWLFIPLRIKLPNGIIGRLSVHSEGTAISSHELELINSNRQCPSKANSIRAFFAQERNWSQ